MSVVDAATVGVVKPAIHLTASPDAAPSLDPDSIRDFKRAWDPQHILNPGKIFL